MSRSKRWDVDALLNSRVERMWQRYRLGPAPSDGGSPHRSVVVMKQLDFHDMAEAGRQYQANEWKVADTTVNNQHGTFNVMTDFCGLDFYHGEDPNHPPVVFETMVFGPEPWSECKWHYATWQQAAAGHEAIVKVLEQGGSPYDVPQEIGVDTNV